MTLASLLIGFLFAINGLNVVNSYVAGDFMTTIAGKPQGGVSAVRPVTVDLLEPEALPSALAGIARPTSS